MKTSKIIKLRNNAIKEAQKEIDKIFYKYSKSIVENIASQLPKNWKLISVNGLCFIENENGEIISYGNSWSITAKTNKQMDNLADLQYGTDKYELQGNFSIPNVIISNVN